MLSARPVLRNAARSAAVAAKASLRVVCTRKTYSIPN